jgi:sugar lactone lactonase YvrE
MRPLPSFSIISLLAAALLSGCVVGAQSQNPIVPLSAMSGQARSTHPVNEPAASNAGDVYVANLNNRVTVYTPHMNSSLPTISKDIRSPHALAIGRESGDLYVADLTSDRVTVYAPGRTSPAHIVTNKVTLPQAVALSAYGKLYVANGGDPAIVTVYAAGTLKLLQTISQGITVPGQMLFDKSGKLYVLNLGQNVAVYLPGKTALYKTISADMFIPISMAMDSAGKLYVANNNKSTVTVYKPDDLNHPLVIKTKIAQPATVLIHDDELFVLNGGTADRVAVFSTKTLQNLRNYTDISGPVGSLAVDSSGYVYVGLPNDVYVYKPNSTKLWAEITNVLSPGAIAVAP